MKSLRLFYCSSAIKIEIKSDLFELILITPSPGKAKIQLKRNVQIHSLVVDDLQDE
jgi:hypothetical protein